ncbi:hypothetical protein G159_10125 [Planococcus glaciei CHR43]|nr:hypothetical protein G159_10125 [Planococcus glaciei CHR43]
MKRTASSFFICLNFFIKSYLIEKAEVGDSCGKAE